MWVIAGLGNPGPAHRGQRHNIGFMALDRIVARYWPMGKWRSRFQSETLEFGIGAHKVLALKPQTFMNVSGNAVGEAMKFFKLPPAALIVLHDDLDLDPGRIDVKTGGGHGGHNGLKSIDAHVGKEYIRIRFGIGHPVKLRGLSGVPKEHKDALVTQHVLSDFSSAEHEWLDPELDQVADALPALLATVPGNDIEQFRAALRGDPIQNREA